MCDSPVTTRIEHVLVRVLGKNPTNHWLNMFVFIKIEKLKGSRARYQC